MAPAALTLPEPQFGSVRPAFAGGFARLLLHAVDGLRRNRARRQLDALDDHLRRDVGLAPRCPRPGVFDDACLRHGRDWR